MSLSRARTNFCIFSNMHVLYMICIIMYNYLGSKLLLLTTLSQCSYRCLDILLAEIKQEWQAYVYSYIGEVILCSIWQQWKACKEMLEEEMAL